MQISEKGHFRPIGSNGFYRRGGARAEVRSAARRGTGDDFRLPGGVSRHIGHLVVRTGPARVRLVHRLERPRPGTLLARAAARCGDGLHVDRVNGNQGAESTLAFLLSLAEMRLAQNMVTSFREPDRDGSVRPSPACQRHSIHIARATILSPDQSRVLLRPIHPGRCAAHRQRSSRELWRLPEEEVAGLLGRIAPNSRGGTHRSASSSRARFEQVRAATCRRGPDLSEERRLLIGSYFLAEYSLESAALFNPSIVPHPDQTGLPLQARCDLSSACAPRAKDTSRPSPFERGMIHADGRIEVFTPAGFLTEPRQIPNPVYEKPLFERKLSELGLKASSREG